MSSANIKSHFVFHSGLVSVSYRKFPPRQIVDWCAQNQLQGIEWGGDVHVPPGDLENAREVAQMTRDAGLQVAAYGSYYRCDGSDFAPLLQTALDLGAPTIRVWAGQGDSSGLSDEEKARVFDNLREICDLAAQENVGIALEYHGGTLTDTRQSCDETLRAVAHPNLKSLWQPLRRGPRFDDKIEENIEDLRAVAPFLSNVHVYEWHENERGERQAFSLQNSLQWPRYMEELQKIGGERYLLLEFLPDDAPETLKTEATALHRLMGKGN